jgi:hypothetical protein
MSPIPKVIVIVSTTRAPPPSIPQENLAQRARLPKIYLEEMANDCVWVYDNVGGNNLHDLL